MIAGIIIWLGLLDPTPAEAAHLSTATGVRLTIEQASEHIAAARVAGALTGTDPSVLLAIAWHESRFQPRTITREPGHRVSCGVMTPDPKRHCEPEELTVQGGYLAGARHLRRYLDSERDLTRALVAYAGGHGSVAHPKAGWRAWRAARQFLVVARRIRPAS
jgi:soluble lytic murein transglycosylase-like protein